MNLSDKEKKEILERAKVYLVSELDDSFRNEIEEAIEREDYDGLYDSFYTSLSFGTAGMRGVIGGGTNRINTFMVRKVTQGLSEYCLSQDPNASVVIAYDSRHYSKEFALSAALVLAANRVKTYLYDTLHPVPMLSYAIRHLKTTAGIVITASHNPAKYNGYKVYWSDGGQVIPPHDVEIAKRANEVTFQDIKAISLEEATNSGYLLPVDSSVDEAYYNMVISSLRRPELIKKASICVAYTPLHGSGNIPVRTILEKLGLKCHVVSEQEEPDGAFPTVKYPNPESHDAMAAAIELAKRVKADIVLGTDPDADRLGIAIPKSDKKDDYLLLTGNQIATLLCDYLISSAPACDKKPLVVKSLVTTDIIKKIVQSNKGDAKDVLTGFKYIANEMNLIDSGVNKENYFMFGCEESYGFLTVNEVHDKDAVSTAVVAVEMMCYYASLGISLQNRLDSIYLKYGYYTELVFSRDYEGSEGKVKMNEIMHSLRSLKSGDVFISREILSVEDLKEGSANFPKADVVIIRFKSGEKLVVRPSGTEPKIKYYIFLVEGEGGRKEIEENKDKILEEFKSAL